MPTKKQILLVNVARLITAVSAITVVTLVGIFLFNNPYKVLLLLAQRGKKEY